MKRILVVDCNAQGRTGRKSTLDVIGVGPRLVASLLDKLGFDVVLLPYTSIVKALSRVKEFDLLAVSAMTGDEEAVLHVLTAWRRRSRGLAIVGGPIALDMEKVITELGFDIAVVGEGELPLLRLAEEGILELPPSAALEQLSNKPVPGVAPRSPSGAVHWGRSPVTPRDLLNRYRPRPDYVKSYPWYWGSRVYVEVVRGCSNFYRPTLRLPDGRKCVGCGACRAGELAQRIACPLDIPPGCGYCSVPNFHGWPRSIDKYVIYEEVKKLVEQGATRIVLSAPDFLDYGRDLLVAPKPLTDPRNPPPNLAEIESLLKLLHSIPEISGGEVKLMVENVKPNLVTREVAEVLGRYLEGTPVYIGLETGDPELHSALGRPSTVEECLRAVKLLAEYGLRPYVYLLHGLPGERDEHLIETARLVPELKKLGVERIVLYRFRPLPGSAFENAKPPPPAVTRPAARSLYEAVKKFNEEQKKLLLNRVLEAAIVSTYRRRFLVAYPLAHGPTILVEGPGDAIGCIARIRVTEVVSDRLVKGRILEILKCVDAAAPTIKHATQKLRRGRSDAR